MRTRKPISAISYNSVDFLTLKLEELRKAKIISFWAFISHLPEDDEAGNKEHIHLFMDPAKMLQTVDLEDEFNELDPAHPDKPLKIKGIRSSQFGDWYLYSIHDKAYLASKGQTRKYHYKYEDVKASDEDELRIRVKSIDMLEITPMQGLVDAMEHGLSFQEYLKSGRVPVQQVNQWEHAWYLLLQEKTNRNGKPNHEDLSQEQEKDDYGRLIVSDRKTGEVLIVKNTWEYQKKMDDTDNIDIDDLPF